MRRALPLALALTVGLAALAQAQTPSTKTTPFAQGAKVVIVGMVTSQPKDIVNEKKMQVAIGPAKVDHTLHLSDAQIYSFHGAKIEPSSLEDKMWVRAEGTVMDDPKRIKVTRLQVIGKDLPSLQRSAFYRPGFDQGYMMAVAGTRQVFPETAGAVYTPPAMTVIGKVSSDTGTFETTRNIQVDAAGNTWSLYVPSDAPVVNAKGEKISVHEVSKGQWVRAHGWQSDDLRMRVARMENVGPQEAYQKSTYFRAGEPMGYVERMPGAGIQFNPIQYSGVVTKVDAANNTVTLRDERGTERVFFTETVTFWDNNRWTDPKTLRQGQRVTVQGSDIKF